MMRIVALNEELQNDDTNEDEIQVTKEAEETIATSEYIRALSLKSKGKNDNALTLLQELLDTRVLNEISFDDKTDALFCIRYNCHKNIALMYEEKKEYDLALEHYVHAMNLDDSEVYTMNRLGQLALNNQKWELARHAFEKCLTRNPNHWPAADGILQVLCGTENILGAYGWAMKWYTKDENYKRAIRVLLEITEKFEHLIPFFESVYKCTFKPTKSLIENFKNEKESVFPVYENSIEDIVERPFKPDISDFREDTLNWSSVGRFIVAVYNYCIENKYLPVFLLQIEDIALKKLNEENDNANDDDKDTKNVLKEENIIEDTETNNEEGNKATGTGDNSIENEKFLTPSIETSLNNNGSQSATFTSAVTDSNTDTDTADGGQKSETSESTKPKPRRRCSDLSFLEQWGWHKNRRYSSRKKSQQDRIEIDTTLNGFFKRIFSKYFEENFDNESPFLADIKIESTTIKKEDTSQKYEEIKADSDKFEIKHKEDFDKFLKKLESKNFDLIALIYSWLKYISKYWHEPLTEELRNLYHSIYEFYLNHYDLVTWNQLSNDNFNASYRMALFYMELDHDKALIESKNQIKNEIDPKWKQLYYHLKFNSGCAYIISDDIYEKNIMRLIWLDYLSAKYENDLNRSVDCLLCLEALIDKQQKDNFMLYLPNLCNNNTINMELIKNLRINLQRKISLNNVKNLYDNNKYDDLVEILKDSLVNCTEIKNSDNTIVKIQTQFEVLLESLWNLGKYQECLIWSERCLKHSVDNLLSAPTDTYRYKEWTESVNFILIYIEELIMLESYEIINYLEKYISRLVQSLTKILVHQLDTPFDKNNNPPHPINIKRSWVILYQILLRTEDNSPVVIKQKSLENPTIEIEDIEEILPHTILLLFTAHEFLGRRQWCTRDNGQLLLYTLSNVASKFRAPYMDGYRDLVAEYLEQITYCLYGYPPKKARSRHIEEHDATIVELTWPRAIQLFDLYRPEHLPEFNSYKLDSISADMEQLLLKILPLIPKENDPTSLTINIKDFISGKTDEIPQECNLLPYRIKCLYYLLADYYFKNRDFSKTIKFYTLDLTCEPTRFDSWAGLALSKASKLETKLNSCLAIDVNEFLIQTEEAQKCFEQCIKLNKNHTLLWIEYGSFAYIIHSFCSRNLKYSADTLSMEKFAFIEARKERYLKVAYDCFTYTDKNIKIHQDENVIEDNESHDEKWLHHYMLGKIAEKRKDHPKVFLDHYLMAANFLYESNATYPIKINHNNPSTLSIEALEIFYRTTSAIIKYLEQHDVINRDIGRLFTQVLKELASSPFAYNQAKIDDNSINALKRKLAEKAEMNKSKQAKIESTTTTVATAATTTTATETISNSGAGGGGDQKSPIPSSAVTTSTTAEKSETNSVDLDNPKKDDNIISASAAQENKQTETVQNTAVVKPKTPPPPVVPSCNVAENKQLSSSRRGSQESTLTTGTSTTTTGTGTSSSTSSSSGESDSSSSADSSSSESESVTDDSDDEKPDENTPLSDNELESIYRSCIRNLEECITRFSEHYKSIYRLVNHYLNAPNKLKDLEKCKQLLLGTYKTNLGNQIIGLFSDRKNNNFFNGIWRIPSSEIDRPGGFSSHLVKCVTILLEVLKKSGEHKLLIDIALQLHRTPENDKRYVKDCERKELYQQAITFCAQSMREQLKRIMEKRNDMEVMNLLIDVYKIHKKCIKHMNEKETIFNQLLGDVYRFYIEDKVAKIPENTSLTDLAVRLCLQEISARKNRQKQAMNMSTTGTIPQTGVPIMGASMVTTESNPGILKPTNPIVNPTIYPTVKPTQIPGMPRPRGRPVGSKNATSTTSMQNLSSNFPGNLSSLLDPSSIMSLYSNPALNTSLTNDSSYFQKLVSEYYKILAGHSMGSLAPTLPNLASPLLSPILNPLSQPSSTKSPQMPAPQVNTSNTSMSPSTSSISPKPSAIPQFDIKNLIASAASQVAKSSNMNQSSATISVGQGQLTITPTTSKSSIPSTYNPQISPDGSGSLLPKSNASISVTKVPVTSPSPTLTVKPLSELTAPKPISSPSIPNLPDLPKSLTITPAASSGTDKSRISPSLIPQVSLISETAGTQKYTGKMKTTKKAKASSSSSMPYMNPQSGSTALNFMSSLSNVAQVGNMPSVTQQMPLLNNFSLHNQQVALLSSYAELLGSMGISSNPALLAQALNLSQFQMPTQKRPYTKRARTPKSQNRYQTSTTMQQQQGNNSTNSNITDLTGTGIQIGGGSMGTTASSSSASLSKTKSSQQQMFVPPQFNLPLSKSPILSPSPNPSPVLQSVAGGMQSSHPNLKSSVLPHTSPTKTLQQKLAEKQKANALNESTSKAAISGSGSGGGGGGMQQYQSNKKKDNNQGSGGGTGGVDVIILD